MHTQPSAPLLATLLIAAGGCEEAHRIPSEAKLVTVAGLGDETEGLDCVSYLGTDRQFHYFKTEAGRYFKLAEMEWRPQDRDEMIYEFEGVESLPGPDEPGFEQYVAARDGQIVFAPLP